MKKHWFTILLVLFISILCISSGVTIRNIIAFDYQYNDSVSIDTLMKEEIKFVPIDSLIREQSRSLDSLIVKKKEQIKK